MATALDRCDRRLFYHRIFVSKMLRQLWSRGGKDGRNGSTCLIRHFLVTFQGGTCGFGNRGQKSRAGSSVRPGFEGGQMPLYRRVPKLKGIAGGAFRPPYTSPSMDKDP